MLQDCERIPTMYPQYNVEHPDEELSFDEVEAIGLDGTGRNGDDRFPYTWGNLTPDERERLHAYHSDPANWADLDRGEIERISPYTKDLSPY
jgi:hypothetical protein